nr:unnamed protein product [Callosobruchus analis]
MLLFAVVGFV